MLIDWCSSNDARHVGYADIGPDGMGWEKMGQVRQKIIEYSLLSCDGTDYLVDPIALEVPRKGRPLAILRQACCFLAEASKTKSRSGRCLLVVLKASRNHETTAPFSVKFIPKE